MTFEGLYRLAVFSDFTGTTRLKDDYNLFDEYYEDSLLYYCINQATGEQQLVTREKFDKQFDKSQWSTQSFTLDLSGFALNIGIKFIF